MATLQSENPLFFLDTNIFVYALLASEPRKKLRAVQLLEQALASHTGCVSFAQCFSVHECKQFIDAAMQPLNRVASSPELFEAALNLHDETRCSFYDCLVIAAALQAGANVLYTEDLQHNQLIDGRLRIVNPFLAVANEASA